MYNYRNRVYSPDLGRWLQTDPIRFAAGDVNLYRYCGNDPANWVDEFGLESKSKESDDPLKRVKDAKDALDKIDAMTDIAHGMKVMEEDCDLRALQIVMKGLLKLIGLPDLPQLRRSERIIWGKEGPPSKWGPNTNQSTKPNDKPGKSKGPTRKPGEPYKDPKTGVTYPALDK